MKKLFIALPSLLFIFLVSSCDGPKKSSDQQTPDAEISKAEQSANAPAATTGTKETELSESADNQSADGITGTQLVNNTTKRLSTKLGLAESEMEPVRGILTKTFLGAGEKMENVYTNDQYRLISKDIIAKSSEELLPLLNESQKEILNKYIQK